jgi:hypothetical protein
MKYWIRNQGLRIARLWISTNSRRSIGSDKSSRSNSFSSDSLGSGLMVALGRSWSPEKNLRQRRGGRPEKFYQEVASSRPRTSGPDVVGSCAAPAPIHLKRRPSDGLHMATGGSGSDRFWDSQNEALYGDIRRLLHTRWMSGRVGSCRHKNRGDKHLHRKARVRRWARV